MLWHLVQPPERNGLGIPPDVARRMTIEEALFYLADEKMIKAGMHAARRYELARKGITADDLMRTQEEYMRQRRKYYTGKDRREELT